MRVGGRWFELAGWVGSTEDERNERGEFAASAALERLRLHGLLRWSDVKVGHDGRRKYRGPSLRSG